jgi:DNA polymerase III subunit epsilon
MLLFFDTETTGIANFKKPFNHPSQPRLVQLAAQLYILDGTRPLHSFCHIIKPDGFTIPKEASDIHGITTEIAMQIGVKLSWALGSFNGFLRHATRLVGHNVKFDCLVMSRELGLELSTPGFCTMEALTNICKLPGPYGYKWPKLSEAYKHCFGEELKNAHDALVDITATKRLYDYLTSIGKSPTSNIYEPTTP